MRVRRCLTSETSSRRDARRVSTVGCVVRATGVVLLMTLCGCASAMQKQREAALGPSAADRYEEAYRAGMEAALRGYQEHYLDSDFPYANWSPPLVQRTWIPPRIVGGVFIPGHMDDVIIKPGAWKREFAAPLSTYRPLSHTRPYAHDRAVGWADRRSQVVRPKGDDPAIRPERRASPSRATQSTEDMSGDWAVLPPPAATWLTQ
jgi:hypothetical protein